MVFLSSCVACTSPEILGFYSNQGFFTRKDKKYRSNWIKPNDKQIGIYCELRDNFDRFFSLIRKKTGVWFSSNLAQKMAGDYKGMQAHILPYADYDNIPSMLLFSVCYTSLVGEKIENKNIRDAIIKSVKNADFDQENRLISKGGFLSIGFYGTGLTEKSYRADMVICNSEVNAGLSEEICRLSIDFGPVMVRDLANHFERDQKLLEIAKDVLKEPPRSRIYTKNNR